MGFLRRKKPELQLTLTVDGRTLFDGPARDYPFDEAVIKALAMAFYNDPAPCEIRRAAVRSRIWMELEQLLPVDAPASSLPKEQQAYFPQGAWITLRKEDA